MASARLLSGRGSGEAHVTVSVDAHVGGVIVMADELRPDSAQIVERLRAEGIRHVTMVSGDRRAVAERASRELGLDRVYAELSPEENPPSSDASKMTHRSGRRRPSTRGH